MGSATRFALPIPRGSSPLGNQSVESSGRLKSRSQNPGDASVSTVSTVSTVGTVRAASDGLRPTKFMFEVSGRKPQPASPAFTWHQAPSLEPVFDIFCIESAAKVPHTTRSLGKTAQEKWRQRFCLPAPPAEASSLAFCPAGSPQSVCRIQEQQAAISS